MLTWEVLGKIILTFVTREGRLHSGLLQWGREIGLNSKYIKGSWGFVAEEQNVGVTGWKNHCEETSRVGGCLLNHFTGFLLEGGQSEQKSGTGIGI